MKKKNFHNCQHPLSHRRLCCRDLKLQLRGAECPLWQRHKPGVQDGSADFGARGRWSGDRMTEEGGCKGVLFEQLSRKKRSKVMKVREGLLAGLRGNALHASPLISPSLSISVLVSLQCLRIIQPLWQFFTLQLTSGNKIDKVGPHSW